MKKLGLILLLVMALSLGMVQAKTNDPIGYEINGDVVEIWTPDTTYYFNKTNGVQWVENPDVYWSRNIFSVGYYSGGEWVQMYSADDLGTFNKDIESDYETYVTATLWKDFTYSGYNLRLGIQYHLELEDTDLSVTIYAKNLDTRAYPVPLGISWTLTDIDIPNPLGKDTIYINGTDYRLDGVYDLTFTDMKHDENGSIVYDPHYRIYDSIEYLTLEWDETLPYSVRLEGNGVQSETKVTWMVNAGTFQPGQEKQTTLLWADAEGVYTGIHWDTSGQTSTPYSLTTDGSNIYIVDYTDDEVYKYTMNGTYVSSWDTSAHELDPYGIATDGTNIWTSSGISSVVDKWTMAGAHVNSWSTTVANAQPYDLTTDGLNIYTIDVVDDEVYKYTMAGVYVSSFDTSGEGAQQQGITTDGTNIWVIDKTAKLVAKYTMPGIYVSNFTATDVGADAVGIATDGENLWILERTQEEVYVYNTFAPTNAAISADAIFSLDQSGWFNVTVTELNGVTNLDTVTIQVNTTGDSQNFTLRWTQATNAFSEVSDLSNICVLNPESIRVNVNYTTDIIAFNFNITGGQSGLCDVRVTSIDDNALSDIDLYSNAFTFSFYNWNPTADLIDSAFEQFGIIGYLTTITTWINGLVSKFESSLTRVLALILLQFTVIEQVYNFFSNWATDLIVVALQFSTFYHQIMDGTSPWLNPLYDLGNIWNLIGYDSWAPAAPALLFIWWITSIPERGKQTVGGELQVFLNDINTVIGLISYFVSIFSYVANTIIDYVLRILPGVT